ncbi:MAG: ATP-binding protein [Candidatus Omnitrophica bacterium]|nr:ATP-binding protein [Candidatus Omnitrophota bacterium]
MDENFLPVSVPAKTSRLVLALVFFCIACASLITGVRAFAHYRHLVADFRREAWNVSYSLMTILDLTNYAYQDERFQLWVSGQNVNASIRNIGLFGWDGDLLFASGDRELLLQGTVAGLVQEALGMRQGADQLIRSDGEKYFVLAAPMPQKERVVVTIINWQPLVDNFWREVGRDAVFFLVFCAGIIGFFMQVQRRYLGAYFSYLTLQQSQEERIQHEKMAVLGQMAASISHDLRNPLTGIKMALSYLRSKVKIEEPELCEIFEDIGFEIDYASTVVTNVLTYARPQNLVWERADLNRILEQSIRMVAFSMRNTAVSVERAFTPLLPQFFFDPRQMKHVVVNLLNNAIRAMPQGGRLTIASALQGGMVEVRVTDTGEGIAAEVREKIFRPFFTTRAKGVGLGLSIVYNIVHNHGGTVSLESEPGKGASFIVRVPLRDSPPEGEQVHE